MRTTLAALLVLALLPAAAQATTIRVGIGDQNPATFDQPAFRALELRQVRTFVRWDVMEHEAERRKLRTWVRAARASGLRPLVHLSTDTFEPKAARRPSVAEYGRHARRLVRYLRRYGVRDFGAFNEANHKTQPTWDSPRHAALFFRELWRAVHRTCTTRSCRVVALDVLDQKGRERYVDRFYDRLRTRTWKRRARFVGIHNYSDVNRGSRRRTRSILKAVRRHVPNARFWFTETGGLVGFGRGFRCDPGSPASVAAAERRAARSVDRVFDVARTYRRAGVQRVYLYNWFGTDCAPASGGGDRDTDERSGFDAGLVRADGTPRPALDELRSALRSRTFAR